MSRFLVLTGLLVIVSGLILHYGIEVPYLFDWIGTLPGDIIIKKKDAIIYLPVMTSAVISLVLSLALSVLIKEKD